MLIHFMMCLLSGVATEGAGPTQLILDRVVYHTQAWGEMGIDTCTHAPDKTPNPMRINDKTYEQGIGMHANSETYIELEGQFLAFEAEVGVQWQGPNVGSVIFQVFVDEKQLFDSGIMKETDAPKPIHIDTKGAAALRLVTKNAGDGITCDCANWALARLIPDPDAPKLTENTGMDIGPFAYVRSWDPNRMTGTLAKRTEEFPAADVFLGKDLLPDGISDLTPDTQSKREEDAIYTVPVLENGLGCIGLEWMERRFLRMASVEFADKASVPPVKESRLEYWEGESPWQGEWKRLESDIMVDGLKWTVSWSGAKNKGVKTGSEKIRWVFPKHDKTVRVHALSAYSRSAVQQTALRVEWENLPGDTKFQIESYNGEFTEGPARYVREGSVAETASFGVKYALPGPWKTDRTVLRFSRAGEGGRAKDSGVSVAVDDVLANGAVYVPSFGVYVSGGSSSMPLVEYKKKIAGEKTILERVREMPDQTFAQALEHVHNPVQDLGPMMISLACDNRKFVAERNGTIIFDPYDSVEQPVKDIPKEFKLIPTMGSGKEATLKRHLNGEWLPAPVIEIEEDGVLYSQRTFVAAFGKEALPESNGWLYDQAVCVAEFGMKNTGSNKKEANITLALDKAEIKQEDKGYGFVAGERLAAYVPGTDAAISAENNALIFKKTLAAGKEAHCVVLIPAWNVQPQELAALEDVAGLYERFSKYWAQLPAHNMNVETPDDLLNRIILASQVHCLLAARNEERGKRISAYISSDRYGPLESEANSVIRGMDLLGNAEFARRSHDFFIHRYSPEGFLTTGYTLMGTGWHLWTLAEHFRLTQDKAWLQSVAPEVARVCQWVAKQCEKTRALDTAEWKMPESGLVPPGVGADWNRYAYRFAVQGHYCLGLQTATNALADVQQPGADALQQNGETFHSDLLRSFLWSQKRTPVLQLSNGTWAPGYPGMLYCYGRIEDIIPGEDGNRSWAYDVELGAHHLIAQGLMNADSPEATRIMDHMEDFWFLHNGMGDYPEEKNKADWFSLGGFAKVQPYYCRNAEIYALRDDMKPFIRSYFNTIPTLLSLENLSFWEHFHNMGGWNKTHETGYFLAQTRMMLVQERGNELWLAPFVTNNWLKDGMRVAVHNAPTFFGPVSYEITSHIAQGYMEVTVEVPTREKPNSIVIRLRHPEGNTIQQVTVSNASTKRIDLVKEGFRFTPEKDTAAFRVEF
ncbi:MAG TPA: NPCBM/NEW2 domain-containing protein [Candidatus Hydrogenedentes bacterium]|nr:NPCBM/NEW2 domain-containing protein [Candidatus Hydrogenedentota bacterium]